MGVLELRKWKNSSASQVKAYLRCPSRWHWNKIIGLETPKTAALALGSEKHAELEHYERTGDAWELSDITAPIVEAGFLPELPIPDEHIERRLEIDTPYGPIIGYIDLEEPEARLVTDHKTLSAWKYQREEAELETDPQAIIYCKDALDRWGGDEPIGFRHIYYMTRGAPGCRQTRIELSTEQIERRFDQILEVISRMHEDSTKQPEDVAVNESACGDYGGCPFRGECRSSGKLGAFAGMFRKNETTNKGDNVNFLEKLAARKSGTTPPEPVELEKPQPEPQPEPEATIVYAEVNPPDGTPMNEVPEAPQPETTAPAEEAPKKTRGGLRYRGALVSTMSKTDLTAAWRELERGFAVDRALEWDGESKATRKVIQADVVSMLSDAPQPEPVELEKPQPEEPELDSEEVEARLQELERDLASAKEKLSGRPRALFIGCHPHGTPVVYVDELLEPIKEKVAESSRVPYYALLEYGEGPKRVAGILRAALMNGGMELPPALVVDRRSPCSDAVLDVLVPLYRKAGGLIVERMG